MPPLSVPPAAPVHPRSRRAVRRARRLLVAGATLLAVIAGLGVATPARAASAPGGLRVVALATTAVRLAWNGSATGTYRLRFSPTPAMSAGVTWNLAGTTLDWTRTDPDPTARAPRLSPGATYYVQVKAIDARKSSLSTYSDPIRVTLPTTGKPELPPTAAKATPAGPGAVHLSWSSAGPGVRYRVRYTSRPTVPVSKWKYVDFPSAGGLLTGLVAGTRYSLRVRVIGTDRAALSSYGPVLTATAPRGGSRPVKLMSYNITKTGSGPAWETRRDAVAATIAAQAPAILGLQEAVPLLVTGVTSTRVTQYADMLALIDDRYAWVTSRGSSGTKLAYDTTRFRVVEAGVKALTTLGEATRYAVWATLAERSGTGRVFVVNTHLEPGDLTVEVNEARARQATEILALIARERPAGVPVVVLGDMNSSRATVPNRPYEVFTSSLVDPVGNAADTWRLTAPGLAEHRVDLEYKSYNKWLPTAMRTSYPVGTRIDWFVVSAGLRVAEARTVVTLDTAGVFVGTIPSDHNPVTLTVHLS